MDKTIEQIKRAHQGDKTAREALVKDNLGLVWSIVRRFAGRGCETEDLFQIGSIGLLKAIDKFDLSYEVRFSTYAVPMIAGEIKRFLRDDGIIKVSRSIKEQNQRLRAAREALCTALGREPTLEELAAQIGVSCEEAAASMAADRKCSMDGSGRSLCGTIFMIRHRLRSRRSSAFHKYRCRGSSGKY